VAVVVVILLAIGGLIATRRRTEASDAGLHAQLRAADQALAAAHAEDKGWERGALEAAARRAFAERHADDEVRELHLVQVVDNPGTDSDQAVFWVVTDGGERTLILGRRDGAWVAT
jgi:hypothetical protein